MFDMNSIADLHVRTLLILDGSSDIGAHVWIEIVNLIYLFRSLVVANLIFMFRNALFFYTLRNMFLNTI